MEDVFDVFGDSKERCPKCGTSYEHTVEVQPDELFIFCEHCNRTSFGGEVLKEIN